MTHQIDKWKTGRSPLAPPTQRRKHWREGNVEGIEIVGGAVEGIVEGVTIMKARPVIVIVVEPETRVKRIVVAGVDRAISRIDPRLIRVTLAKSADYVVRFTPSQIDLIRGKAISHMARANQRLIGSGKLGVRVRFLFNPVFNGRTASENQKN